MGPIDIKILTITLWILIKSEHSKDGKKMTGSVAYNIAE